MLTWRSMRATVRTLRVLLTFRQVAPDHRWRCGLVPFPRSLSTGTPLRNDFFKDLEAKLAAARRKVADAAPGSAWSPLEINPNLPPERTDIVIVGGGVVGWSVAYWLKKKEGIRGGLKVVVVEKDTTYSQASSVLSAGGIRQQFSLPENIRLSLASADFLRNINVGALGRAERGRCGLALQPCGLHVPGQPQGGARLGGELQDAEGCRGASVASVADATPREVSLDEHARCGACLVWFGERGLVGPVVFAQRLQEEGPLHGRRPVLRRSHRWPNEHSPQHVKRAATQVSWCQRGVPSPGFKFTSNEATTEDGERLELRRIKSVQVRMPRSLEYQPVECAVVVNAAGPFSAKVARMLGVGLGPRDTLAGIPLPVEPRKRFVYVFHCPEGPGLDTPFLIDHSGVYFRREGLGGNYIAGKSPDEGEEPDVADLHVDHQFFQDQIWPELAHRVPAFEKLKVRSAWAGYYDYNTLDQNGIVGAHPLVSNMYFATGFSGHGLQHSPAVGRAVAELILDGGFTTLDLSRLGFRRIAEREPLLESNII